jgi:hypothetical protein
MDAARLNWTTAEVTDAKLTVELDGELPSGWKKHFETTVKLLGGSSEWGKVEVKKRKIRVEHVTAGSEKKLRHYLEGVVEQANTALASADPDSDGSEERGEDADAGGPDAEMAQRFRSFAEESPPAD